MAETKGHRAARLAAMFRPKKRVKRGDDRVTRLGDVELFSDLSQRELRKLAAIVYERNYEKGEPLFEQGQPGAAMFILVQGSVEVLVQAHDDEIRVATLSEGDFIGELALLDDTPRSASARCLEPTCALAFFRADLNEMLETEPVIGSKIFKGLALIIGHRLKAMNTQLSEESGSNRVKR